ncbi:MAG: hypothetical protein C7B43_06005 [Sulfobacillus benefaciens]|uniref:Uncharacterized protein n=1 Tax=Sulfobacillus benefaciens TaxID=453960 RepID=A0A2T2X7K9_9FIRM|nr:MAG: hypothetical protein C7B43_06005 [Sulfobacillus benefaciens]
MTFTFMGSCQIIELRPEFSNISFGTASVCVQSFRILSKNPRVFVQSSLYTSMMPCVYVWCRHQSLSRNIPYHALVKSISPDVVWDALISNPRRERLHCMADPHSYLLIMLRPL